MIMVLSSCVPWLKLTSQLNPAWSLRIDLAQLEITKQWLVLQLLGFFFFYYLYIIYCRHLHCSCAHLHLFRAQTGCFCLPVFTASARNAAGSAWASTPGTSDSRFSGQLGSSGARSSSSPAKRAGEAPREDAVPGTACSLCLQFDSFQRNTKHQPSLSICIRILFIYLFFFKHSEQVIPILHPVLRPEG